MRIENRPRGVRVIETSADAKVADMIRQHARKVDGFVKEGHAGVMRGMDGRGRGRN
jgi:hypothetical protein